VKYQKHIQGSKDAKAALHQYLMSEECHLFKKTNERVIKQAEINKLFALEKTGPGTIALVTELVAQLDAVDTFVELLEKATALSKQRRDQLLQYLRVDCKLVEPAVKKEVNERIADQLRVQGTAGPVTVTRLKELEEQKKKFAKIEDFILPVQKAQLLQRNPLLAASFEDLEQLLDYFASPECKLLNAAQTIDEKDLHDLWRICPTTGTTLDYCKYLQEQGVVFDHVMKLTGVVKNMRNIVHELYALLTNKTAPLFPPTLKITTRDADSLYLSSCTNPLPVLQECVAEKRKFTSMEQLRQAMITLEKKKGADCLREFFNQRDVKLLDRVKQISDDQFYTLIKVGGNIETTIQHCKILNQKRQNYPSTEQLAKAIHQKHQELRKEYEECKKILIEKKNFIL